MNIVITINTIVAGYIKLSIGADIFIIAPTPKVDITKLNKHTAITICSYFNLFLVKPEKYSAVADVKPIAVVKHANVTIKDKTTFPGVPSKATVIATINADCDTSTPYWVDTVAPR